MARLMGAQGTPRTGRDRCDTVARVMWLALVLFVAMSLAVLRGGRLSNLADIRLRYWWLLVLGFLLQAGTSFLPDDPSYEGLGIGLILGSYVLLLGAVLANRRRPGLWLSGLGILLNLTVIALNGGMPVLTESALVASGYTAIPSDLGGYKHVFLDETSRLPFLADVIPIRIAGQGYVLSLGDVFLALGVAQFLEAELRKPVQWFKPGVKLRGGSASSR